MWILLCVSVNVMQLQHQLWKRLPLLHCIFFAPLSEISSVHFSHSVVSDSAIPWTEACQVSLSITNSQSLRKVMSTVSVMPSNHLILCRPLLPCLQSFPASGSFPMSWLLHQVAKVLEFQLQHHSFQ